MVSAPTKPLKSPYITHLASFLSQNSPMNSVDEALFASLILDGGQIFRYCAVAAMASWVCTLVILLRRPKHPTNVDLAIVRFGFWLAIPLLPVIGFVVDLVR